MDTSSQPVTAADKDKQATPTQRRRYRSVEEKRRIVEKTLGKGASVARVARDYGVNANQVFTWRSLYKKGELGGRPAKLLPASVAEAARNKSSDKRQWSLEEKQQIVKASLLPGACVKEIAELYGVHPSLIYDWRKKHRQRNQREKATAVDLLPVTVSEACGRENEGRIPPARAIEIELPKGRLRILGADAELLRAAVEMLQ